MAANQTKIWTRVSRSRPCPVCAKFKGCLIHADQTQAICLRVSSAKEIKSGLGGWLHSLSAESPVLPPAASLVLPSARRAEPANLGKVYRALLDEHLLSPKHLDHLQKIRHLTPAAIEAHGYRSWGFSRHQRHPIAQSVYQRLGGIVLDTPGVLVREQYNRSYLTLAGASGIAIPVINPDRQIVGLQILSDSPDKTGKYTWASSTSRGGPGPGTPVHVARPQKDKKSLRVWITEGPLKANIACEFLEEVVLAIPGIGSTKDLIPTLQRLSQVYELFEIVVALDSDWHTKEQVAKARSLIAERIARAGFTVWLADWAQSCKGLDDLLIAGGRPKLQPYQLKGNGPRALEATSEKPAATAPRAMALEEARTHQLSSLNQFLDTPRPKDGKDRGILLNALPGTGKSHAITESINRFIRKRSRARVSIFVARHDLARGEGRDTWAFTRGRHHTSAEHPRPPCHKTSAQGRLQALRIPAHLGCDRCPLLESCRHNIQLSAQEPSYLAQFQQGKRVTVYPLQHFLMANTIEYSRVVALDDCDLLSLCLESMDISRSHLENALDWAESHPQHPYADAQPLLALLTSLPTQPGPFVQEGTNLFALLEQQALEHGLPLELILEQAQSAREPDPFGDQDLVQARLDVPMRFIEELVEVLQFEYGRYRSRHLREWEEWNCRLRLDRPRPAADVQLTLKSRRSLPIAALRGKDLIISDASLTLEEVQRLFPERDWTVIQPTLRIPDRVTITQFPDQAWGKVRLSDPEVQAQALDRIGQVMEKHPGRSIALITHKFFADVAKKRFPQLKVGHFYGQRGSNAFKDCDVEIIFGTPHPNPQELLRQAQALHWDEPTVLPHEFLQPRTFQSAPGSPTYQVAVRTYADRRLANLLRSKVEDELLQSIYRIRPLSVRQGPVQGDFTQDLFGEENTAPEPREQAFVYIFSSRPLAGLPVQLSLREKPTAQVIDFQAAAQAIHAQRQAVTEGRLATTLRTTQHEVRRWKASSSPTSRHSPSLALAPPAATG